MPKTHQNTDPLGELKALPQTPNRNKGREGKKGKGIGKGRGKEG